MFQDQIIKIWVIVYDENADRVYTFTDWERVKSSIGGAIRIYLDDSDEADAMIADVIDNLNELNHQSYIPLVITEGGHGKLTVSIYRWEIEATNPLHRILSRCYDVLDDPHLKQDILALFSDSKG